MNKGLLSGQIMHSQESQKSIKVKRTKNQRDVYLECKASMPGKSGKKHYDVSPLKTEFTEPSAALLKHGDHGTKTNKRKKSEDDAVGHVLKKTKKQKDNNEDNTVVGDNKGRGSILQLTRKQRRNRKQNNNKKNKYKHLDACRKLDKTTDKRTKANHIMPKEVEYVNRLEDASKVEKSPETSKQTLKLQGNTNAVISVKPTRRKPLNRKLKKNETVDTFHELSSTSDLSTQISSVVFSTPDKTLHTKCGDGNVFINKKMSVHEDKMHLQKVPLPESASSGKTLKTVKSTKHSKSVPVVNEARLKLNAARFRYLNEQLYTSSGRQAFAMFENDPEAFTVYHQGFQAQASKWPINPLDVIIKYLHSTKSSAVIADFGCGDATLAERLLGNKVHSFDLVASKPCITACDIAKVPLEKNSVDVAVFCLSLMGTNLSDYLCEANRVLRTGGVMKIAEVVSRFFSVGGFVRNVEALGFHLQKKLLLGKMFMLFTFKKVKDAPPRKQAPRIQLKACHYKRR